MPLPKKAKITPEQYEALLPLSKVKEWAKVQYAVEDSLFEDLRAAVIQQLEKFTGKMIVRRAVSWKVYRYYTGMPLAYLGDADLVVSHYDGTETLTLTDPVAYQVGEIGLGYQANHPYLPQGQYYQLDYTAGYDTESEELDDFLLAAKEVIANHFVHRTPTETGTIIVEVPLSAKSILHKYIDTPILY